ncbi:MAG TPA: flagellar motor protein MotB [Rugosimonospora sp.]|nr:flagellar motor protein MotB [Rugosimonospora sp.]
MSRKSVRPKRKKHEAHEEHVNHERWLVTYADMLTLLMVLFIVMFAMSQVDAKKFALLKEGLAMGFGGPTATIVQDSGPVSQGGAADAEIASLDPGVDAAISGASGTGGQSQSSQQAAQQAAQKAVAAAGRAQAEQQAADASNELNNLQQAQKQISEALKKNGINDSVLYTIDQRGLVIHVLSSSVVFAGNRADLLPGGQRILDAMAPTLRKLPNDIEVDGHTNQLPGPTLYYPSAWELSTARASTVVRYLIQLGMSPDRLTAAGFAGTRPLYPPSDPRSVTRNRRVDIVVLSALPTDERALMARMAQ